MYAYIIVINLFVNNYYCFHGEYTLHNDAKLNYPIIYMLIMQCKLEY